MQKKWIINMFLVVLLSLFTLEAHAATQKVELEGEKAFKQARGEAVIRDAGADQKQIQVKASGLKPNSVYTLWFVTEKPRMDMAGVGTGDYSFRTDSRGTGQYTATVPVDEIGKWDLLEVAYHPDANPANMKDIDIALKGELPEEAG